MGNPKKMSKGKKRALEEAQKQIEIKAAEAEAELDIDEEPEEPEEELALDEMLVNAIAGIGVATVLKNGMGDRQIKLRLRISNQSKWKHMLTFLLREEIRVRGDWNLHVCQHYLLYKDRLVYTWNFILQSEDLDNATRDVCRMFDLIRSNLSLFEDQEEVMRPTKANNSGPVTRAAREASRRIFGELEEYPLIAPQDRNRPNSRGKGASFMGAGG